MNLTSKNIRKGVIVENSFKTLTHFNLKHNHISVRFNKFIYVFKKREMT